MNLILQWNNIALDAIRALGRLPDTNPERARGGPPQVARSLAVIYTAVYDAWSVYDDVAKPVHAATPRRPVAQRTLARAPMRLAKASMVSIPSVEVVALAASDTVSVKLSTMMVVL